MNNLGGGNSGKNLGNTLDNIVPQKIGSSTANQGLGMAGNAMGTTGSTPWGMIGNIAKTGYNTISGKKDNDYSDTEQAVIYPLQGASIGSALGPWGALGGALYGLCYSFKDDIGFIRNNDWLDKMLFPIDLGGG